MQETSYRVLAPGPVNLHPDVQASLAKPMIHHRTPEFDQILGSVLSKLKPIFQTQQRAFVSNSTGSGGMEALIVNTMNKGDLVIGVDSGKFGERWCEMVTTYGGDLNRLKVPWGESVSLDLFEETLKKNKTASLVVTQACETSTGALHPIQQMSALVRKHTPQALFLVDGITALGALPLPMDDWDIDGIVGGSQKAFMLPTGLSMFAFSERAWKKINSTTTPCYYFDVRRELKANEKGETFFSSNVTLTRALNVSLDIILKIGLDDWFSEIQRRAELTRRFGESISASSFAQNPSSSLTALLFPTSVDTQKLRLEIEQKDHITVMGGQDQMKGRILRIGHMGYQTPQDYELTFKAIIKHLSSTPQQLSEEVQKSISKNVRLFT